jgi:hypothetical protein
MRNFNAKMTFVNKKNKKNLIKSIGLFFYICKLRHLTANKKNATLFYK